MLLQACYFNRSAVPEDLGPRARKREKERESEKKEGKVLSGPSGLDAAAVGPSGGFSALCVTFYVSSSALIFTMIVVAKISVSSTMFNCHIQLVCLGDFHMFVVFTSSGQGQTSCGCK